MLAKGEVSLALLVVRTTVAPSGAGISAEEEEKEDEERMRRREARGVPLVGA